MDPIWNTILKYFLNVILGFIVTGCTFLVKKYIRLSKEERIKEEKELIKSVQSENDKVIEELRQKCDNIEEQMHTKCNEMNNSMQEAILEEKNESKEDDAILQQQIEHSEQELKYLKAGLLSMQGKQFKENCRKLLEDEHVITFEEWEEIDADHEAYNGLGGNHNGDYLYELVKKKVEHSLTD